MLDQNVGFRESQIGSNSPLSLTTGSQGTCFIVARLISPPPYKQ